MPSQKFVVVYNSIQINADTEHTRQLGAQPTAAIRHLLILVIFEIELSDHNLDVGLGGSLQQLLQPH